MLSAQSARDSDMDQALYDVTMDEVDRGWLEGPLDFSDLSADATVSRRFGVRQGSTNADGTRVAKVCPIDDLKSLVNLTNGGEVTIAPMGVDAILASIAHRVRGNPGVSLRAKTIDLRKAYKNLPVSERAMSDSHLLIFEPGTNKPLVYRSKVLVFGARASVLGFCRTAVGLWAVGVRLLFLHWTQSSLWEDPGRTDTLTWPSASSFRSSAGRPPLRRRATSLSWPESWAWRLTSPAQEFGSSWPGTPPPGSPRLLGRSMPSSTPAGTPGAN